MVQFASENAPPSQHFSSISSAADQQREEEDEGHNFIEHLLGVAQIAQMQNDAQDKTGMSLSASDGTSAAAAAQQMEAIRQLSAAVVRLGAAVDCNSATVGRLETTVDKMCAAAAHVPPGAPPQSPRSYMRRRPRAANASGEDLDDDDSDAISELFPNDNDDSQAAATHARPAAEAAEAADDGLDRKTVRLDGLEVYAVVSAVTAGTLVAVFDSYHPGDVVDLFFQGRYLEVLVSSIFFVTGSIGIICGLHCIFVFSLVTMYGRTALGMERDDALEVFFAGTGLQRYHGFKTFVGSLYSMMILLIVSITSKMSDRPSVHLAALALTARLMHYVYVDTQTIMEKAGIIFAPPPPPPPPPCADEKGEGDVEDTCVGSKKTRTSRYEDDDSIPLERLSRRPSMVSTATEDSNKRSLRQSRRQSSLTIGAEELIKLRVTERSPSPPPIEEEVPAIQFSPSLEANANRHKILKVLRALDPRGDNFHKGKERANRLAKFRAYVDGRYTGGVPPNFIDEDITLLLLGTADDGDRFLPGLLRACGVPSKNHQGVGDHILLKKSAHGAIELLRYLVCDLGNNPVQKIFSGVFCSLPPSELRQIRLSLHIAGFGGKREGSKEDACQILTHYLSHSTVGGAQGGSTATCSILDDLLPRQDARIALRGWIGQQPEDIQNAARPLMYLNQDGSARSLLSGGNYSGDGENRRRGKSLPPKAVKRKFQKQPV